MSRLTVAVTTAAKAAAMTNATASSTRLPRRMKFLKPVTSPPEFGGGPDKPSVLASPRDGQEVRDRGRRDGRDLGLPDAEHHPPPRQSVGGGGRRRRWQRQHQRVPGDRGCGTALRIGRHEVDLVYHAQQ